MDDPLLVGMLHRRTNLLEKVQTLDNRQTMLIAIVAQRYTLHQLHDEKRRSRLRRPRVQKLGYVRMVHHRDRLTLRIESRQYLLRLPSLDPNELQRHLAPHRLGLVRHPDRTHAPLANLLAQNVPPANLRTFSLRR